MANERPVRPRVLVIACGALARELLAINRLNGLDNVTIECLPASLHNRPSLIPDLVRRRIRRARARDSAPDTALPDGATDATDGDLFEREVTFGADNHRAAGGAGEGEGEGEGDRNAEDGTGWFDEILIGYADCGTGGMLAQVCAEEGVEMLAGAHCYQFFATEAGFDRLQDHALGSFYLTDFLARNFDRLVWEGLGIAKHPELLESYFGNYTRLVYLQQTDDPKALACANDAAERLGLELHVEPTGYGELETSIVEFTRRAVAR